MKTGYQYLDALIDEVAPGDLVIVSGRSGIGRSPFTLSKAQYAARQGEALALAANIMQLKRMGQMGRVA